MRIVLAGGENLTDLKILIQVQAPSVVFNYYYLEQKKDKGKKLLQMAKEAGIWVLVSSGSTIFKKRFPWLRSDIVDENGSTLDPGRYTQQELNELKEKEKNISKNEVILGLEKYFDKYCNWLKEFNELFDVCTELDLDSMVGMRIWEWRNKLKEEIGSKVIIIPHTIRNWDKILPEYNYIGFESNQDIEEFFKNKRRILTRKKIKIHGQNLTNQDSIQRLPCYSVTSMSWITGGQYGQTFTYSPGSFQLKTYAASHKHRARVNQKHRCEQLGVNYTDLMADKRQTINLWNAFQWRDYAVDMLSYTTNAYWLSKEEKKKIQEEQAEKYNISKSLVRHSDKSVSPKDAKALKFARFCNSCFLGGKCPMYQMDSSCALHTRLDLNSAEKIQELLQMILSIQGERVIYGAFVEKISGTPLDQRVSTEMQKLLEMMQQVKELSAPSEEGLEIKAKGTGVVTELLKVFSKMGSDENVIETTVVNDKKKSSK